MSFVQDLKIVFVGAHGVGKTCIVKRAIIDSFDEKTPPTVGGSYHSCPIRIGQTDCRLQIWDTAGQERYRGLTPIYYRQATVAIIVYSIADQVSFDEISEWKRSLDVYAEKRTQLILVGNKADLEDQRVVSFETGEAKAREINAEFCEVSAQNGFGVEDLLTKAGELALQVTTSADEVIVQTTPVQIGAKAQANSQCTC
jgi:small GTP-binding protein